jgi:hypothetical protein
MRISVTVKECRWLSEFVKRERLYAEWANKNTPHPRLKERHDDLKSLESKLNTAMEKQNSKER